MEAVFCSSDRGRGLQLKELLKKRPVFEMPPFRPKERIFPKPSALTLVLASQINLLWILNFTEWQWGKGDGARRREGDCVPKREFYRDADFLFTSPL